MLRKNTIQRKKTKTNTVPALVNSRTKVQFKHSVSVKFQKKIRTLEQINRQLIAKIRSLTNDELTLQDIKIKYLTLKEKVLEAEEQLLMNGIDTSEYPLFCMDYLEEDTEINNEIKCEVLSEGQLNTDNKSI
ncbi:PREDICTED: uncharacterized protein LOC107161424 [Diuraphis noxia]|uniref:uncharacterized protein LOC107161424 n=1 Tax=Diuraphis noxia TaxID=143948 RepID=UPI000763726F|nr:PREDICTED: uncharacterized protein LOC107161424 [Diuraphis noxia]